MATELISVPVSRFPGVSFSISTLKGLDEVTDTSIDQKTSLQAQSGRKCISPSMRGIVEDHANHIGVLRCALRRQLQVQAIGALLDP